MATKLPNSKLPKWASLQWYESTQYKIRSYFMSLKCQEVLCTERTKNQLFKIWLLCTSSISMSMFQCSTSHVTQWQILMSLINSKSVHLNQQREHHLKSTTATVSTDLLKLQTYCMVLSQKWSHCNFVFIILQTKLDLNKLEKLLSLYSYF